MVTFSVLQMIFVCLSALVLFLVHYEDNNYKPFGLRYWLGLVACVWAVLVSLLTGFIVIVLGTIMVYSQFEKVLVGIFLFCLLGAALLTFLSYKAIKIMIRRTRYYQQVRKGG